MKAIFWKRSAVLLMALSLAFMVLVGVTTGTLSNTTAYAATGLSGSGTAESPYLIQSAADLDNLRNYIGASYRGKEFKLTKDIDLKAYSQWNPIGTGSSATTAFQGNLNGDGYAVYNINIERPNVEYQGLFGSVFYGTIRNIGIGSGTIIGGNTTGGIVAYLNNGNIVNSYNKAMVGIQRIWNDPGGIAGTATNYSHIEGCFNAGHINGEVAGGIVGTLSVWSSISNSYNTGVVTGLTNDSWTPNTRLMVGGIVGFLSQSSISHSYNTGRIERYGDKEFDMGGLVGNINDTNHSALGAGLYFDVEKSGVEYGVYASTNPVYAKTKEGARTTAQMLQSSTYTAFDFENKWFMKDGDHTPMLRGMLDFNDKTIQPKVSYTVTFSGNGGILMSGQEVQQVYKGDAAVPPVYTMEGFTHNGFSGGNYNNVTSDMTLASNWVKAAYSVQFDYAGGVLDTAANTALGTDYGTYFLQAVEYGMDAVAPILKRGGYTFAGWDKSIKFITGNTTITALWSQGGYSYVFDGNGGTLVGDVTGTVAVGSVIASYPSATRVGYTFVGWSRAFVGSTLYLTAMWEVNPTVQFDLAGGTSSGGGSSIQTIPYGGSANLPTNLVKEGFDFAGWDKSETYIFADTTITAQWVVKKYLVTFVGDGGVHISGDVQQMIEHGMSAVAPVFQKTDAMFAGWDTDFTNIVAPVTVKALWNSVYYTVTFDANGGVWDSTSHSMVQDIVHGGMADAPRVTRDGYTFIGWSAAFNNVTSNMTIKAQWALLTLSVKFQGNGGSMADQSTSTILTADYGASVMPPAFYRTGYVLTGWKVAGGTTIYSATRIDTVTEHLDLEAQWAPTSYTVTFNGNGGIMQDDKTTYSETVNYGQNLMTPSFTKVGNTLSGWKVVGTSTVYQGNSIPNVTQDLTLEAQWSPIEFTVKFQGNGGTTGGSADKTVTVLYGQDLIAPAYTREGHILTGWLNTSTGETVLVTGPAQVKSNMVLTAQWKAAEYTVTFVGNGGTTSAGAALVEKKVLYGFSVEDAPTFYRTGYAFAGWNVASLENITQSMTVQAQWSFKAIAPNVQVDESQDGTTLLTATGLPEIDGVTYTYRWEKLVGGNWVAVAGGNSDRISLAAGEDYSNYRVVIGVQNAENGNGTTGPDDDGYASGEDSFTDSEGKPLDKTQTGAGGNIGGSGLSGSQKLIITIAVIVGIMLLLLIIILVARSISRERQKSSNNQWY